MVQNGAACRLPHGAILRIWKQRQYSGEPIFAFNVARNEAIRPGGTAGMSQAVAISEDGRIYALAGGNDEQWEAPENIW